MRVIVVTEYRFARSPDGRIWTQTVFPYSFWAHYLSAFSHVVVLARVRDVGAPLPHSVRADGEGVTFSAIPYYVGPFQYLTNARRIRAVVRDTVHLTDAVIIRAPSQVGSQLAAMLAARGQPFGLEIVGDPFDVFAPGGVRHLLRPFFRWIFSRQLRRSAAKAAAVGYVTAESLQRRYPAARAAFTTNYSSIDLPPSAFALKSKTMEPHQVSFRIISVGSLEQLYKAPDVLISAAARCVREGLDIKVVLVGDGKYRSDLETLAEDVGIKERCVFLGQLPAGEDVRRELDAADLFVLPSRTEGLPRALIEAMARGLPCIGSTAGGIPELLPPEDMVPPGDVVALGFKIREVLTTPGRMRAMGERNLAKSREYEDSILTRRRDELYRRLCETSTARMHEAARYVEKTRAVEGDNRATR